MADLLVHYLPGHEAHACYGSGTDGHVRMDRRYDAAGHHVRHRQEYPAFGTAEFPDAVRHQLQPGLCVLYPGIAADPDLLHHLSETDLKRRNKRRGKINRSKEYKDRYHINH